MESNIHEIQEVSQKISGREDIITLYQKYGHDILTNLDGKKMDSYNIWKIFTKCEQYSILNISASFCEKYLSKIDRVLVDNKEYFNITKIKNTIKEDMIRNILIISNDIWTTEIRNFGETEEVFFKKISKDFSFFNEILGKYPYWYMSLNNFLFDTTEFLISFLKNLIHDHEIVTKKFIGDVLEIDNLHLAMGDRHRGKFVIEVVTLEGNFFYKPRSGEIDNAFRNVLNIISSKKEILDMCYPEFIDYKEYSWFNKINYKKLSNAEEFRDYYIRLGQTIAVIYVLNGGDLHYENIISHGPYPIIIDSEPLLTNRLRFKKNDTSTFIQNNSINYLDDSVRNSLILPNIFNLRGHYFEFSPLKIYDELGPNTPEDEKKTYNHKVMKSELNAVSKFVCLGFERVYEEILENREDYKKYITNQFKNLKLRFLNKPTDDYSKVRDLLRNPVCFYDFRYAFAVSSKILNNYQGMPEPEEISEQAEILNFNIPYFEIRANSKDLIISSNEIIEKFFVEKPIDGLIHKINILGEIDLHRQLKIIREMFSIISPDFKIIELNSIEHYNDSKYYASDQEVKTYMEKLVEQIFDMSTNNPLTNQHIWTGPELEGDLKTRQFYYRNLDYPNSYYSGSVGILTGLLKLGNYYGYNSYIKKLIVDIEIDIDNILSSKDTGLNIGAYNGISQYIKYYIDLYCAKKVKFDYFIERVDKIINKIYASLTKDKKLDILDGTAGVSIALIALLDIDIPRKLKQKVIKLISKCNDHLINSIIIRDGEYYFPTEQDKNKFFTGFAHGTSGISTALYKSGKILSIDNSKIIEKILETERKYYNKTGKYWYRDNDKRDVSWGWCHGIPGILLSRVELFSDGYRDKYLLNEIEELYNITIHESLGTNLTFCHGDPGNLTICKYVQQKLSFKDDNLDKYIKSLLFCIVNSDEQCIRGNEAPGLVQGKMGIVNFINAALKNDFSSVFDIIIMTSK